MKTRNIRQKLKGVTIRNFVFFANLSPFFIRYNRMSSRYTVDTNILRIRDVYALNPLNADYVQVLQIPSIDVNGKLRWYSTLELLSSISVPSVSCSVLDILTSVQPGISTMSTIQGSTINAGRVGGGRLGPGSGGRGCRRTFPG